MNDFVTKTRTNCFKVTDVEKLMQIIAACKAENEIIVFTETHEDGAIKYGFACDGRIYGLSEYSEDSSVEKDENKEKAHADSFYKELQSILPDDDAAIITSIAFYRMRSLIGCCTIITKRETKHFEIGEEAVKLAKEMLGNPDYKTVLPNNSVIQEISHG